MFDPFFRAGKLFPALVLFAGFLFPLFSQEAADAPEGSGDFFQEDYVLSGEDEGITVTASPETTQQMKVLTREDIEAAHAPDLAVLLQETLDLGITRYGPYGNQTDINMRGFDSERIAFLINGVPVNSPVSGDFELSTLDLNDVDRIEVIYGGSDSKYNVTGALGGVINIITVKQQDPGLRIGGVFSNTSAMPGKYFDRRGAIAQPAWQDLLDTQNISLSLGLGLEKFSGTANLFANRAENHFLFTDNNHRVRRKDNTEVWDTGVSSSLIWDLPGYTKLIAGGDFYYGDKNIPTSGFSSVAAKQTLFSTGQNLMLETPRALREDLATEASLSHGWQTLDHGTSSRHDLHTLTAINRWHWYPLDWFTLRLGGDYRYSRLDSTDMGPHDRQDGGAYLTAEYRPLRQFLVIPSIKAVFSGSEAAPVTPVPKLGLLWTPGPSLTLKNNYFRSFKLPDFEDLYWEGGGMRGNPDLKPEDGWGLDLGAAWQPKDRINLEGTFFTQWTVDSIHWYGSGGQWKPENVGEAAFFGLTIRPRFEIPLSRETGAGRGPFEPIVLSLSYQYLGSYLLSYGYDYSSDKRIPYMPVHGGGFSLDVPWKIPSRRWEDPLGGSLRISGHYQGPRYADTANLTRLKPYFLLNVNLTQEINRNISAFASFRNILNQSYESFNDYYMPGLTVTAGIRANYLPLGGPDRP
jgi:vitamin B12 transporter